MDAIVFGVKRAHLVLQHRLVSGLLKPCGLTPARFDTMFAMLREGPMTQRRLRADLGIARSTLSRMLRALERLEFVVRDPFVRGRTRNIALSGLGRAVLRYASRRLMRKRVVRFVLDRMMTFGQRCDLESLCSLVRQSFRDSARNPYPWHPDD